MVECRWIHHDIIQAQPIQVKRMKAKCSKLIQLATSERGEAAATNALQQATQMRSRNPNLKIIAAIGGWSDAMMYVWSDMAANSNSRMNFANNIFNFLQRFNLNGIDIVLGKALSRALKTYCKELYLKDLTLSVHNKFFSLLIISQVFIPLHCSD
jgi:Glycosyl hydrolases family 18